MATSNWTANSNDALHLSLGTFFRDLGLPWRLDYIVRFTVRANKDKEALRESESFENFHPSFTYPVCSFQSFLADRPTFCGFRYMARMRIYMGTPTL
jgi:hypothetical protein